MPDVNVLVYAFRRDEPRHEAYAEWIAAMLVSTEIGLAETVLLGLVRVVTNPRVYADPAPAQVALQYVEDLRAGPRVRDLAATAATWSVFREIAEQDRHVRGNLVPDAWLAALARSHGARLATADRGFARFEGLEWFVPVPPSPAG